MRYLLLFICSMTHAMYRETILPDKPPYIHVETLTRVLRESTTFIDSDDHALIADAHNVAEVTIKIHKPNRPIKVIKLTIDI